MARPKKKQVLLLNADQYTAIKTIPFNDAVSDVIAGKYLIKVAMKGEYVQGPIHTDGSRYQIPWPVAVYVNRWVEQDFKKLSSRDTVMATRMAILHRDQFTCQYCEDPAGTWDHIMPQSKGGQNTWLNLVAACQRCNGFKADLTLDQAEEKLLNKMLDPSLTEEERAKLPPSMRLIHEPFVPDHDPYRRATKDIWNMLRTGEGVDLGGSE
jgi:5-methylcytosine-specific restriction endonuclease McrA